MKDTFPSSEPYLKKVRFRVTEELLNRTKKKISGTELLELVMGHVERAYDRGVCVGTSGSDQDCPD